MVPPGNQEPAIPPHQRKKPGRRKLGGGLLALGSLAVASVYAVGYASTQSSIDDLTAQLDTPAPVATSVTSTMTSTGATGAPSVVAKEGASAATPPTASAAPAPTATTTSTGYADGTYTGRGSSRHGSITATVVIHGGQIVSASVTDCGTRYPCSDVNPLVSAVLTNQQVPGSNVSGATDSSRAYRTAVSNALQQALVG
jgi:uncharacterized protein with FMN-binding domain